MIYACAYADFLAIDRDRFDILGVTGNSMGWYIALACAGALDVMNGFEVVPNDDQPDQFGTDLIAMETRLDR